ncbi:MAG: (2Fe-2S)-binding protein [Nitrospinota bacterium]
MSAPVSFRSIEVRVNGRPMRALVPPHHSLLEVLRGPFHLTGVKEGCGNGECGACSVIVDGQVINACLYLAIRAEGREIQTIEGLAENGRLHPLQETFITHGAVQCGYCTPGMVLTAKALLDENPSPTREEVETALAGNICRCTGYRMIVDAVLEAAQRLRSEDVSFAL